jgi:hypothetical protein
MTNHLSQNYHNTNKQALAVLEAATEWGDAPEEAYHTLFDVSMRDQWRKHKEFEDKAKGGNGFNWKHIKGKDSSEAQADDGVLSSGDMVVVRWSIVCDHPSGEPNSTTAEEKPIPRKREKPKRNYGKSKSSMEEEGVGVDRGREYANEWREESAIEE